MAATDRERKLKGWRLAVKGVAGERSGSMIPKSGYLFSDKIMLQEMNACPGKARNPACF